ncbi:hypothetical protein AB0O67_00050 [Streptomyces sp. NPDC086077]
MTTKARCLTSPPLASRQARAAWHLELLDDAGHGFAVETTPVGQRVEGEH